MIAHSSKCPICEHLININEAHQSDGYLNVLYCPVCHTRFAIEITEILASILREKNND